MGKNKDKNKDEVPNPTSVTNRDILQRLNFLYQASVFLNGLGGARLTHPCPDDEPAHCSTTPRDKCTPASAEPSTSTLSSHPEKSPSKRQKGTKKKTLRRVVSCAELSRSYVETMKSVGQKTNVKMDPSVKRRICKHCNAPLIPGISATVRIKDSASHGHLVSYQCHACHHERCIPAPPVLHIDAQMAMDEDTMHVEPADALDSTRHAATTIGPERHGRKKKGPRPRLPPHFARDVGHVVFRGNERLDKPPNIS